MAAFKGHRGFAALWDRMTRSEPKDLVAARKETAAHLHGRVLEIGVGVGTNWAYLAPDLDYTGIEPDAYMRERAQKHASERGETRNVIDARAEALPFEDETFDSVLCFATLCTIADPAAALAEVKRVLKPGGNLAFYEHVRPEGAVSGRLFDVITPPWRLALGGCHPNRRTEETIAASGLELGDVERGRSAGLPFRSGVAHKPG